MLKKLLSTRVVLTILLVLSIVYASFSIYYKIVYWGFNFTPKQSSDIWTVEAHISFEPTGEPIKITLTTPKSSEQFKVLEENVTAEGYKSKKVSSSDGDSAKMRITSPVREGIQNVYYRVMLFDNVDTKGKTYASQPATPKKPVLDEQAEANVKQIIALAKKQEGNKVVQVIKLLNQVPAAPAVQTFLPVKKTPKDMMDSIRTILSYQGIPNRIVRGFKLEENRKSFAPDLMLEAYLNNKWMLYNIATAEKGLPDSFVLFQRGGEALIDIEGGQNSNIKFTVLKSVTSSLSLAGKRAKLTGHKSWFDYSIYSLPLAEQNTLKWLTIFPVAILMIVLIRNVVGLNTMGTFTPMLLSMSLVKTGFWPGLLCFGLIIVLGLIIRFVLSKLNLLLVPRISAVVIFVILIMQFMTVIGYQFKFDVALSAVFFPIIIMAWIIERASITWEEDGAMNAGREVFFSLVAAVATYFIISDEYIRHIMFAFNEINLVILCIVMLLGTYTGYRLTELKRFSPLVKEK